MIPDRYAVIGCPIGHSQSPAIHRAFADATGQTLVYEAIEGRPGHFADDLARFRAAGGLGLNITVPFKVDAFACATQASARARAAGAVNAIKFDGEQVLADNFDGMGLVRDLTVNLSHPLQGRRVLLLGAGGAARGAIGPLLEQAPARLCIANRSPDKARQLVQWWVEQGSPAPSLSGGGLDELAQEAPFDVIINATSASLGAQALPLPDHVFHGTGLAYDMVYGKGLTPFLAQAQAQGVPHLADGVGMLVEQAAEAFAWWRGVRPVTAPVIQRMSRPLI